MGVRVDADAAELLLDARIPEILYFIVRAAGQLDGNL